MRRRTALAGAAALAVAATGATAYTLQRRTARRWQVDPGALAGTVRDLPADLVHHTVEVSDGGALHVVERGQGTPVVLVHGVTLGVATWAPQLHSLSGGHRVIAIGQRGHGRSVAGSDGYGFDRLADDLAEVLASLDVTGAVLVGHSMGGMVAQTLALRAPGELRRRVDHLVLLATAAGPMVPTPLGALVAAGLAQGAGRRLRAADRRGRPLVPQDDLAAWATRASFGAHPDPHDLALLRGMLTAMSPGAMAELMAPLLAFDVHRRLPEIDLPTTVVVGTRDLLTPPRAARVMAAGIPGAELVTLPGCGHMVMLERPAELDALLERLAR